MSSYVESGPVVPEGVHWVSDWGHGWLCVPSSSCAGLAFSEYSYDGGDVLYLEEDIDAGIWLTVYGVRGGRFSTKDHGQSSPVRELPRFGRRVRS